MVKIRSTQKLATSNTDGLCYIQRKMLSYKEDLETGKVTIIIADTLFQEKEVTRTEDVDGVETEVTVTERKIIEKRQPLAFVYNNAFIDAVFSQTGITISKTKSYTQQQNQNKTIIMITQTVQASSNGWNNMTDWAVDEENCEIVNEFTE